MDVTLNQLAGLFDYSSVISDTYTLIAGFVAIGVPLSLQILANAAEKYDNAVLVTRIVSGRVVTPKRIIVLSVFYVCFSFLAKLMYQNPILLRHPLIQASHPVIELLLVGLFLTIIIGAGVFYFRLYNNILKPPYGYAEAFLQLNPTKVDRAYSWYSETFIPRFLTSNGIQPQLQGVSIKKQQPRRYTKKHKADVHAGLEILLEQSNGKNWNIDYTDLLQRINQKFCVNYFGGYRQAADDLSPLDMVFIKLYWDFLLRLIRSARDAQDAILSFSSQRDLAALMVHFIHHRQYEEINRKNILMDHGLIDWTQDMFEIARWQAGQPSSGVDLILECEWMNNICKIPAEISFKHSGPGTNDVISLANNIIKLAAEKKPNVLLKIYINISEGFPFLDINCPNIRVDASKSWVYEFYDNFDQRKFTINDYPKVQELLETLKNGKALRQYGNADSKPLTPQELKTFLDQIELREFFIKAYCYQYEYLAIQFIAILAFYKKWQTLNTCLEWHKPRGSSVSHCDRPLLPSEVVQLQMILLNQQNSINNVLFFIDRHEFDTYVYQGAFFILLYYYERYPRFETFRALGSWDELMMQSKLLPKLIQQADEFNHTGVFDKTLALKVKERLEDVLEKTKEQQNKAYRNTPVSQEKWHEFLSSVDKEFDEEKNRGNVGFNIFSLFNPSYTLDIQATHVEVIDLHMDRIDFVESAISGGFFNRLAYHAFGITNELVYQALVKQSQDTILDDIPPLEGKVIFANIGALINLGFVERAMVNTPWQHNEHEDTIGVFVDRPDILIIERDNVKVKFTQNVSRDNECLLFSHYEDKQETSILVKMDAYFDIEATPGATLLVKNDQ